MNQTDRILGYLKRGYRLTPIEALRKFGTMRLGARIWDIRQMGYPVQTRIVQRGHAHVAEYSMT